MNKLMIPKNKKSVALQRKHKARLDHINYITQVTQAALDANAEINGHSFFSSISTLDQANLMMEAYRARYGNNPAMEAAYQNMVKGLQAFNHSVLIVHGDKLVNILKNIPNEPRDVGFWEEIATRIRALLLDKGTPTRSLLDEIRMLSRDAKHQLSSASKAHLQNLKTILAEIAA